MWKWHYRDALPNAGDVRPAWHTHQTDEKKKLAKRIYDDDRPVYLERMRSLLDPETRLKQDVEQTYVLHWNEFYKNAFLSQLRKVLIRGVTASVVAGLIALVVAWVADADRYDGRDQSTHITVTVTTPSP
jgi:hypothetical protein